MPPLSIMVKPVSGACNMRCRYCFYADVMTRRETRVYPRMSMEALEVLVRRALRFAGGPVNFAFQGGEPTLIGLPFFEALVRFEKEFNARGLPISNAVQTNGYDLSDDMIAFFAREKFLVGVSLDGDREAHDKMRADAAGLPTFDRVRETVGRLSRAGAQYNILCVVNEYVARRPREVFQALAPHKYVQFIACLDGFDGAKAEHSLTEAGWLSFLKATFDLYWEAFRAGNPVSVRNFDNYVGILLGMPPENCAMSGRCAQHFLIEADGGVYPCDFYVLDEWRMGNILETPFSRLVKSEIGLQFREESHPIPEICGACPWLRLCRNGCKRERVPETGLNRWCACFREFFEYGYPRMEEMARQIQARER